MAKKERKKRTANQNALFEEGRKRASDAPFQPGAWEEFVARKKLAGAWPDDDEDEEEADHAGT